MFVLDSIGVRIADWVRRWLPEAFVFALGLTVLVSVLVMVFTPASVFEMLRAWYQGFSLLLAFTMQVLLILCTGFAVTLSTPVQKLVDWVAKYVRTPARVYFVVTFLGGAIVLVNWGLFAITAVLARQLALRVKGIDYPYLSSCVWVSIGTWVAGLSSSIPLLLNTEGNFLITGGVLTGTLPVVETLGSILNLSFLLGWFLIFPALMVFLRPRKDIREMGSFVIEGIPLESKSIAEETPRPVAPSPSDRMNHSPLLVWLTCLAGAVYIVWHFATRGFDLNLNIVIFIMFMLGIGLHASPVRYGNAMRRAASGSYGIIYQYPFYGGIMGMMIFTGLAASAAGWLAGMASFNSLPFISALTGAMVNFAIPSAGGEWAVVGPTFIEAAKNLSAGMAPEAVSDLVARIALAMAYGESSTNLLQPFFFLLIFPALGVGVKIRARDIVGYNVLPFIVLFVLVAALVTWIPI